VPENAIGWCGEAPGRPLCMVEVGKLRPGMRRSVVALAALGTSKPTAKNLSLTSSLGRCIWMYRDCIITESIYSFSRTGLKPVVFMSYICAQVESH
jgi:hypothetical protein